MLSGKGWFTILHTTEGQLSSRNPACVRYFLLLTMTGSAQQVLIRTSPWLDHILCIGQGRGAAMTCTPGSGLQHDSEHADGDCLVDPGTAQPSFVPHTAVLVAKPGRWRLQTLAAGAHVPPA